MPRSLNGSVFVSSLPKSALCEAGGLPLPLPRPVPVPGPVLPLLGLLPLLPPPPPPPPWGLWREDGELEAPAIVKTKDEEQIGVKIIFFSKLK